MAAPSGPTDLSKQSLKGALVRTVKEFREDNMTDWAAALTYYAVLALFPGLMVLVSLLGLFGQDPETFNALLGIVSQLGPESAVATFRGPLEGVIREKATAGALLGVGVLVALWSASGYIGAFVRASNAIYETEEGRPFWALRPLQLAITLAMVLLLALLAVAMVITGPVAEAVGNVLGAGDVAVTVWSVVKWPVAVLVVTGMFGVLYYAAPNVRHPRVRWVTPGSLLAVVLWILASGAFGLYVASFGSYNKTYGSIGGMIVFLLWLWISNNALLLGAEFDAELERSRQIRGGMPKEREPFLPPRDEPAKS